ncbi:MAG: ribosomal protein S18-alanine N-acetyltransferase [Candidatus Bathyarchaeota archaeon]|nr:MAG: ribosomal protein S18-alanine N-acetyltransferase [Candidatus Bathyarchaeota archaeon]
MFITVQQATTKDLETLYEIERECFTTEAFTKEQIAYLLKNPDAVSLVAQIDDENAGFIIGLTYRGNKARIGHIYTIDVAVKHRRKGIGLRLLNELEQIFVKKSIKICHLEVRIDNVAARELYHKQGYIEMRRLKDYYPVGIHGVQLKKKLEA